MKELDQALSSDPQVHRLIEQARQGDERAFAELVRRFEPFVRGSSFKVCRDLENAGRTTHDTFINVFRKLHQFDGESKFTTWLYTIVVNNCLMNRRRRKLDAASVSYEELAQQPDRTELLSTGEGDSPERRVLDRELAGILDEAVEKLPETYRDVFILRDLEQLSIAETAERLNLTPAAVKSRLHRARAILREELRQYVDR